ncbi:MAG: WecB/TagA/CpsF family glycosyltransferase [Candidatus Levybacteria bacterium]|nr:WecB/TagA/CpsF family glycosyltransferase [Candidatus Levybacteria bacterium]
MLEKKKLLGVGITNATEREILEYILQSLQKKDEKYYIVTPNPEILVYANNHQDFKKVLNNARLAIPDGTGVIWAGKVMAKNFKERVTGIDLVEKLCFLVNEKPITVGFLGGGPKIAERTAECLMSRYPGLDVVYIGEEWGEEGFTPGMNSKFKIQNSKLQFKSQKLGDEKANDQRQKTIDILFVAFGFPKQEEWIVKNLDKIPVKVAIGVGGAFDYISGRVKRAPTIIQKAGFEWLYRLLRQPWRIKRQLALLEFTFLVLKEKFTQ